jgi:hypothetical protein
MAFTGAIAVPVLFVMTASSNLKKQSLISLISSEPSPPRLLHWPQSSIAFDEMAAARFRFLHTDKATTVPSAGSANNQVKSTLISAARQVGAACCGK